MKAFLRGLLALAYLGRLGMSPLTISVPILGALAAGQLLSGNQALGLGLVGLTAHLFGFGLNDLIDAPLDRTVATRSQHPLATGQLSRSVAWIFVLIQLPLCLSIYAVLSASTAGFILLLLSAAGSVTYNLWSKWGRLPRLLPELALAASIALLCLAGGLLNGSLPGAAVVYALALGLVLLLLNSVASGLKDLKTDAEFGARSFILATGSGMLDADKLYISPDLRRYSAGVQILILGSLMFLLSLYPLSLLNALVVLLLGSYAALHLRMLLAVRSFQALRGSLPLLNGYYNYGALVVLLIEALPTWLQVLAGLYVMLLLTTPLRLSITMWRKGYTILRA